MSITRRTLYDEIDQLDAEIAEFNERKSGIFDAYRQQLKNGGSAKEDVAAEITACKKAFRRLRALDKDADAVLEADALVDEIVVELQAPIRRLKPLGTNPATRVQRARSKSQLAASTSSPPTRGDEAAPRVPSGVASPIPDESRANARDEAMPQDSPQGVGKVERASRLVTGRTVAPGRDGRTPAPISEAAPALGDAVSCGDPHFLKSIGFRTDATSSRFAVSTQQVTSLPDGGNLAGSDNAGHSLSQIDPVRRSTGIDEPAVVENEPTRDTGSPAGSLLSETDAVGPHSIAEPAGTRVSTPRGEIELVSDPGFSAGSPIPGSRGGVEGHAASTPECLRLDSHQLTARGLSGKQDVRQSGERPDPREADTDPSLDIMTQPFYRGGAVWPR